MVRRHLPLPHMKRLLISVLVAALAAMACTAQAPRADDPLRAEVVRGYARCCHHVYAETETRARAMQRAIEAMLAAPDETTLAAARAAWTHARRAYCLSEVFRFYDGPIEALEPLLNAWPIDESYIDYVEGDPDAGIVHDRKTYPQLGAAVLEAANERGGEANISVGWHAIEFLLWGQDLSDDGPGRRPATDYVPGTGRDADRRGAYLRAITTLLVHQLGELRAAWAPDADNYRRRFEADPDGAVRRMLTGAAVLSAFELTGERLAVAYETKDQEQEHSCFSDTTWNDFEADQLGLQTVLTGGADGAFGPGLLALVRRRDPAIADLVASTIEDALAALRAIPQPFDQAMRGDDDAPGRVAIRAALAALEAQTEALTIAGRALGHDLPLKPGGSR